MCSNSDLEERRQALHDMRLLLARFLRGEVEARDFIPAFGQLFSPFDPGETSTGELMPADTGDLTPAERNEYTVFARLSGGPFGEYEEEIPRRQDWQYGVDPEPYGWIDADGYRAWISRSCLAAGIDLSREG